MATETLSNVYTSEAEMQRLLSLEGVELRLDDLDDTDDEQTEYLTEVIADATDVINAYLLQTYSASTMETNRWIRSRATWIGCYFLSQRRGNPPPEIFETRYSQITDVESGELYRAATNYKGFRVPRLVPLSAPRPVVTNYKISDLYQTNKIRVKPENTTGDTYSGRLDDPYPGPE